MIISHSAKFIFVHIQRTGGSTVVNLLKKKLGMQVEIISQHGNASSEENYLLSDHKEYFTFAFVRNPWDRILSWYLLINKHNLGSIEEEKMKFQQFIELDKAAKPNDPDFHYNQLDYISDSQGNIHTNKIYRFENFSSEINALFNDLNLSMIDIPQMNKSIDKKYQEYYTEKSRKMIATKCFKDIDYFGYQF